jgi:hypothetical protein
MKITLTQPVQHDGKAHAEGDVIDIAKADAEALIACGSAEPADSAAKKAAAKAEAEAKAKAEAEAAK